MTKQSLMATLHYKVLIEVLLLLPRAMLLLHFEVPHNYKCSIKLFQLVYVNIRVLRQSRYSNPLPISNLQILIRSFVRK